MHHDLALGCSTMHAGCEDGPVGLPQGCGLFWNQQISCACTDATQVAGCAGMSRQGMRVHAARVHACEPEGVPACTGAVQTVFIMLNDEKKQCAAVTMLGKTAELCVDQARSLLPRDPCSPLLTHRAFRGHPEPRAAGFLAVTASTACACG